MKHPLKTVLSVLIRLSAALVAFFLLLIIGYVLILGIPALKPSLFEWKYNSENVSMMPAIINTLFIMMLTLVIALPVSISAAIYLNEYARDGKVVRIIRMTAETLSGIPSIVYGLFGYIFFSTFLHFGYSLLSGSLTLSIMILPIVMRTTEEALKEVPMALREGSYALGCGKLGTIFRVVIPSALPSILSGVILAVGRIVGETAALIYTAGSATSIASSLFSSGRTLSVHMYALMSEGLHMEEARATSAILLILVLAINGISRLIIRRKGGKDDE